MSDGLETAKRINTSRESCCECNAVHKRLASVVGDNRKATAHQLETARLDLQKNEPAARNRLEDVSELKRRDRELLDSQKMLIESIKAQTRLEQELHAVRMQNDRLRSSMNATKAEHEKTVARLRAESSELNNRLERKSVELAATARRLNKETDDGEMRQQRTERLRTALDVYMKKNGEERTAADQQIAELEAQVESAASELVSANARLRDAQAETARLECRLRGVKGRLVMEVMKTEFAAERKQEARETVKLKQLMDKQETLIRRLEEKSCVPKTTGKRIAAIHKDDDDNTQPLKPYRFAVDRGAFEIVADCECALADSTKSDVCATAITRDDLFKLRGAE